MNLNRIRKERKKKGYTLQQVADATGYSTGYISQLERGQKEPSLAALRKIANFLGCSEVWLIMGDSENSVLSETSAAQEEPDDHENHTPGYILRKSQRIPMKIPEIETTDYSIFTPNQLPDNQVPSMTGLLVSLKPGAWVTETMIAHQNMDESVFLLKGNLEAHVGTHVYEVEVGDSFYVPQGTFHNYLNTGQEEALFIVYFSGLIY